MKVSIPFVILHCVLTGFLLSGCEDSKTGNADAETVQQKTTELSSSGEPAVKVAKADQKASEVHPGKALHDANCISCHDSGVYSREDRKMGDFPKLLAQVGRCDASLGARLFGEDVEVVANYLNDSYYKHEK